MWSKQEKAEYMKAYRKLNWYKIKETTRLYLLNNPEKRKLSQKKYRRRNIDKLNFLKREYSRKHREKVGIYNSQYYQENKDRIIERNRKSLPQRRKRENTIIKNYPLFRLRRNLGTTIYLSLKSDKGGRKWQSIVGYTLEELKLHLEKQFKIGMSWENYGVWHLDHIKPSSLFDFSSSDEIKECWALDNLQPLWGWENSRKRNKYCFAEPVARLVVGNQSMISTGENI